MIDPDQLIKEMLDLKVKLEDFAERMERVESVLFDQAQESATCGSPSCWCNRDDGSV